MNTQAPQVLNDIVTFLQEAKIKISEKIEGEGRGGSLKDEGTIKRLLQSNPKFKTLVRDVPPRRFGDMLVKDYDTDEEYVVNIKTSIGSADNATSKMGFLYAFTDLSYDELPGNMSWNKFYQLLSTRGKDVPNKDYWFLCVDKNDTTKILVRGAKQIVHYGENANPGNLLQIDWRKEKLCEPADRTYDQAYEVIINGIGRCYAKAFANLPKPWQAMAVAAMNQAPKLKKTKTRQLDRSLER